MKFRGLVVTAVVASAVGWTGRAVFSGDEPPKPPAGAPGGMDEMFKAAGKPGEEHARLTKALEGDWTVHGKMHEMDGSTSESDGTATFRSIFGGRYVTQEFHGEMHKEAFEGRGVLGYDNSGKQFVQSWIDSMGTGLMTGTGQETEKGKVWSFQSSFSTPMGPMKSRQEMKVVSDKEFTFTMYMAYQPGAPEAPVMELTYKRK